MDPELQKYFDSQSNALGKIFDQSLQSLSGEMRQHMYDIGQKVDTTVAAAITPLHTDIKALRSARDSHQSETIGIAVVFSAIFSFIVERWFK